MTMRTLMVANRGEIALRVFRTAARLGITTVAVYTELDAEAPHVRAADVAVPITGYLDIEAVVEAARTAGADAIHPGYGFLSENAAFAQAVTDAGLTFVGPSAEVIRAMGRKDRAREIAISAGVPVVPVVEVRASASLETTMFPVLVKAAAGGGGKGMRVVRAAEDYDEAVAAAKREAASAFGNDTILVEKYVERGRHIEVQVIADGHGNVLHLGERDCSTQRRHQKVLEEAPAPTLEPETRDRIRQAAVDLAREVGYQNAGTVEFLLDTDTGEAYFLEMNTRLQVEHPVTEMVTGLDLVELQLAVADQRQLPIRQDEVRLTGHAIEARIYAEDSFNGFLPQAGSTSIVRWPPNARVDHALERGQTVSTAYDPMLGKIIVHAPDREAARRALLAALDDTAILGLTTNTGFLRALVASDEFRDAAIDTAWLDTAVVEPPSEDLARTIAAWTQAMVETMGSSEPFQSDGWRLGAEPAPVIVELDRPVRVDRAAGFVENTSVTELSAENHTVVLIVDGRREQAVVNVQPHFAEVVHRGQRWLWERPDVFGDHAVAAGDGTIVAPMPGSVIEVRVEPGQQVAEGDVLGVLEAMKMELALKAPFAGTVTAVDAAKGAQVALGATLFVVEALRGGSSLASSGTGEAE
jgi:3-methylcrotonyl-CoA carboxylase alpha subunit/acetyl-CoA/propionyl-CoA carboxylase biotin carboxyl carrier protein